MSAPAFGLTYDYRCPFARNAHEHVLAALAAGAPWEVEFLPFSLSQAHVREGGTAVWEDPTKAADLLAVECSLVVRDEFPDLFPAVHLGLFAARHDKGRDLRDPEVIGDVLTGAGVDADRVRGVVDGGGPRKQFRAAHDAAVADQRVFGVPTFVLGNEAVFVRIMTRPGGDGGLARRTVERILDLVADHGELNEFKHTSISN